VETQEQYPKKVCFSAWGDKVSILKSFKTEDTVKVSFNIESREFNGRWYTDLRVWKIEAGLQEKVQGGDRYNDPGLPTDLQPLTADDTIQLDYVAPERFELGYIGSDNSEHRPVVIHRAIYGSFERFIGILIEHYAGNFPVWLAPEQARIQPVSERHHAWAEENAAKMRGLDLRIDIDRSHGKLGAMIRDAQLAKIPYALVIGDKEVEAGGVSPRKHGTGKEADLGLLSLDVFIEQIRRESAIPY
jgi:hypothetical protein